MKRRLLSVFIVSAMLFVMAIPVFAANFPAAEVKDGNTYLGTFKIADQSDEYRKLWDDWKHSDRNVMLASNFEYNTYYFFTVPDDADLVIEDFSNHNGSFLNVKCNKTIDYLKFQSPVDHINDINFEDVSTLSAGSMLVGAKYAVCGTYFNNVNYKFPPISYDCFIDFEGTLILVDDIEGEISQEQDSGLIGWLKKILDWLKNFFKKLKDMFMSLFVPRDGFFNDWFKEIKAAFEDKLGGLADVFNSISGSLGGLSDAHVKDSTLMLKTYDNYLFKGYKGVSVDILASVRDVLKWLRNLLNGLVIIFTVITCYKQLVRIIKT